MADQYTDNYNLTKPEIGGSIDTWGAKNNTNMDDIDTQMKSNDDDAASAQGTADAAVVLANAASAEAATKLPKDGSEEQEYLKMAGRADTLVSATKVEADGAASGVVALDAELANYFRLTLVANITDLSFDNLIDVTDYAQVFIIDITSAGFTIDWTNVGTIAWAYGVEPVLSTTGGRDIISLITLDGGTTWTGALSQPDCQ